MKCPACGTTNAEGASVCASCDASLTTAPADMPAGTGPTASPQPPVPIAPDEDKLIIPAGALIAVAVVAILGILAFVLLRGDGAERYPEAVRRNFVNSCMAQGASAGSCECMIEELEERMSLEEFTALESTVLSSGQLPPTFLEAIQACQGR